MTTRRFAAPAAALLLFLAATTASSRAAGSGSVGLTDLDVASTQDFDTLASSTGTAFATLPAGWFLSESGTSSRNNDAYAVSNGSDAAGDVYSFGPAASPDRAFGTLLSGTLTPIVGAAFTNNTGAILSSFDVTYAGEQWRAGVLNRPAPLDRLDFQYSLDATSLTSGTWNSVDALDVVGPSSTAGNKDGNSSSFRTVLSATVSGLAIPAGATFWIRWTDANPDGADDGLAVDDFSITPHGGGGSAVSIGNVEILEGDGGAIDASFTVTVTGPHSGVTFDIATADGSGPTAATAASGDYGARSESAVTIPAGETSYTFAVAINGDTTLEPDETFVVNVTNVTGAVLGDGEGLGTIVNDDEPPPVDGEVVISQIYGGGGNAGATLTNDFVELFNRGTTAVDLTGWSVQYAGAATSGTWSVTPLSGSIAPGGYYLVQQAAGSGGTTPLPTPDATGTIAMSNGAGKVALQNTTAAIAGACPLSGTADLVGYGATANCFEGAGATANTSNTTAALRKRGGCFDSDSNTVDFAIGNPVPRNSSSPVRSCVPIAAAINQIQGAGTASPLAGLDVITTGIVAGVKSNGFFLQEPDSSVDANPLTSEGIFVFTSATPAVAPGHAVAARGTVGEFFNLTQIEASLPGDIVVQTTGNPLPAAIALTPAILDPAGAPDQLEPLEAMRVHADSLIAVGPTNEFGEIATVLAGVPRPLREPGIPASAPVPPDPTSGVPDCCIAIFDENPERIAIDSDGLVGSTVLAVTSKVTLDNVTGPLDFTFGAYKILPEASPVVGPLMSGIPVPTADVDELTVGGFNVENFAGGATQRQKASLAIRQLMRSPDVIGHIEIFDLATLQGLADQVNADTIAANEGDPAYQAVLIPAPAGGTQNVGFLVKTSRVRIDGVSQERGAETYVNPNNGQNETLHDRPPLVLRATFDADGVNPRPFIVAVNHLRSFIDIEAVTGEGLRVRAKRKAQAESVAGLLQELQTDNPGTAVISIGDYNAYEFSDGYTDPIATLKGTPTPDEQIVVDASPDLVEPDFSNLTDTLPAGERYTFVFEGTPQALDHVLVNTVAATSAQRYAIARGNADFPAIGDLFAGNPARPEGASDHDMPVAYFRFPPPSADLAVSAIAAPATVAAGANVTYTIMVTNNGISPAQNVVVSGALPAALGFVSCAASGGGACGGTPANPTATFARLAAGASETVTIVAAASCGVANGASLTANAVVSSATSDPEGGNNTGSATVVASNAPPTIGNASANPPQLLTLTYALTPITIDYTAADACGPVTTTLSVTSNEAVTAAPNQQGKAGSTSPDWQVVDDRTVLVRAERSVKGDGRVYTIAIRAVDAAGNVTTEQVTVTIPRHLPD